VDVKIMMEQEEIITELIILHNQNIV